MHRLFFFFQAEDGIRDVAVTGVQTCALPIFNPGEGGEGAGRVTRSGSEGIRPRRAGLGGPGPRLGRSERREVVARVPDENRLSVLPVFLPAQVTLCTHALVLRVSTVT